MLNKAGLKNKQKLKIIYKNGSLLVVNKPGKIIVFPESKINEKTLVDFLLEKYPELKNTGQAPRYGIVHRLDKETSGILLVAKNNKTLEFLQKQFKDRKVIKKYLALVVGKLKAEQGIIETLVGRSPKDKKKQKVFLSYEPGSLGKRKAITKYRILEEFQDYTLVEAELLSGRKHQIRVHFSYLGHPLAGDKLYGFKSQPCPKNLKRQFLHASYLKIELPDGKIKEFYSVLPDDLKNILNSLK